MITPDSCHTAAKSAQRLLLPRWVNFLVVTNSVMIKTLKLVVKYAQYIMQLHVRVPPAPSKALGLWSTAGAKLLAVSGGRGSTISAFLLLLYCCC